MVDQKLTAYIKKNLSKGASLKQIKEALIKAGWSSKDINNAINSIKRYKEPKEISEKWDIKKIIVVSVILLVILGMISIGFWVFKTPYTGGTKINSIETRAVNFIKDSRGLPISIKFDSEVTLQGEKGTVIRYSCKLTYADEFVDGGIDLREEIGKKEKITTVTLVSPIRGKLDLGKWDICCDLMPAADFNAKTESTVCAKGGQE